MAPPAQPGTTTWRSPPSAPSAASARTLVLSRGAGSVAREPFPSASASSTSRGSSETTRVAPQLDVAGATKTPTELAGAVHGSEVTIDDCAEARPAPRRSPDPA